ncbi:MAG: hypothetical protein BECKG1743D_GA0114223_110952, partial [Candidatus Kentron sp. G]
MIRPVVFYVVVAAVGADLCVCPVAAVCPVGGVRPLSARIGQIPNRADNKAISIKEYTNLLVFIVQLLRCNNSYIVHDAPAARLESERKSCAIRYILFCQSPY